MKENASVPMHISQISLLMIAVCLILGTARAQNIDNQSYPTNHYLPSLIAAERATSELIEAARNTPVPVRGDAIWKLRAAYENLGTQRSFIGDTDGAIAAFDKRDGEPRASKNVQVVSYDVQAEDAIKAIVEQARSRRVVLINEAHHVPMNRAFTQKLAAQLRKIGYTYLACEAFSWEQGKLGEPAPTQATVYSGYLIRDPVFAGFVNAAIADGWKLVPYEYEVPPSPGESRRQRIDAREQGQARNIVERIFAIDKNAKVLIHVGYGHLDKSTPDNNDMPTMMGEHLRRMTGLEMIHVDQTSFYAHPDLARETPIYAALIEKFPSKEPFVLRTADGSHPVLLGKQGRVDMQVIFPRYANHNGRPDWLRTLAGRNPHPVPAKLLPTQGRRLIKAFRVGDGPDAVPIDIVLVEARKFAPALMLPPGDFRYSYEDEGI